MEVSVTINRGTAEKPDSKSYLLKEVGASKKGTYATFSPMGESADLPSFTKLYVKVAQGGGAALPESPWVQASNKAKGKKVVA